MKMYQLCFTILLISIFVKKAAFAQQAAHVQKSGASQTKDTIFLKKQRSSPRNAYHVIYIDTGSKAKAPLINFRFNSFDSANYFSLLRKLPATAYRTQIRTEFPRIWIALYRFKGAYYLYNPSDFGNHFRFAITDSTTIDYTMEGAEPSRLIAVSFPKPTQMIISRTNYWESNRVKITIVDTAKGIAVFSFGSSTRDGKEYHVLMVDAMKAYLYPTIVNHSMEKQPKEFKFDSINFQQLLK